MKRTVTIYFDATNAKDGERYVKWIVTESGKRFLTSTGIIITQEDAEWL